MSRPGPDEMFSELISALQSATSATDLDRVWPDVERLVRRLRDFLAKRKRPPDRRSRPRIDPRDGSFIVGPQLRPTIRYALQAYHDQLMGILDTPVFLDPAVESKRDVIWGLAYEMLSYEWKPGEYYPHP